MAKQAKDAAVATPKAPAGGLREQIRWAVQNAPEQVSGLLAKGKTFQYASETTRRRWQVAAERTF